MPVYFAVVDGRPEVKIGYAADVQKRLGILQVAHVDLIRFVRVLDGTRRDDIALKERFAAQHRRGDWFDPHPDMWGNLGLPDLPLPRVGTLRERENVPTQAERETHGRRMKALWADPVWRARRLGEPPPAPPRDASEAA